MAKKPPAQPPPRLAKSLAASRAFAAALPPPNQSHARPFRVIVALSEGERGALAAVAESRGEPLATTVRTLAVHAAEMVLGEKG